MHYKNNLLGVSDSIHLPCLQALMVCLPHGPYRQWGLHLISYICSLPAPLQFEFLFIEFYFHILIYLPYCLCFHELQSVYPYPISIHSGFFFHDPFISLNSLNMFIAVLFFILSSSFQILFKSFSLRTIIMGLATEGHIVLLLFFWWNLDLWGWVIGHIFC